MQPQQDLNSEPKLGFILLVLRSILNLTVDAEERSGSRQLNPLTMELLVQSLVIAEGRSWRSLLTSAFQHGSAAMKEKKN